MQAEIRMHVRAVSDSGANEAAPVDAVVWDQVAACRPPFETGGIAGRVRKEARRARAHRIEHVELAVETMMTRVAVVVSDPVGTGIPAATVFSRHGECDVERPAEERLAAAVRKERARATPEKKPAPFVVRLPLW